MTQPHSGLALILRRRLGADLHSVSFEGNAQDAMNRISLTEGNCKRNTTASWNMKKQLGAIALGLSLALCLATGSWAQGSGSGGKGGARGQGGTATAPAVNNSGPSGWNQPERCFAASPWG